jgi:hypothetical protein
MPIGNGVVQLHGSKEKKDCCNGPGAAAVTARGGRLEFKKAAPADCWIQAKDQEYKTPVRCRPATPSRTNCSDYLYELNGAGRFDVQVHVTLD